MRIGNLIISYGAKETPKVFGLKEAEAALPYAEGREDVARAIRGVAVAVLGHKDIVEEDVVAKSAELAKKNVAAATEISRDMREIAEFQQHIDLLQNQIAEREGRAEMIRRIADTFK